MNLQPVSEVVLAGSSSAYYELVVANGSQPLRLSSPFLPPFSGTSASGSTAGGPSQNLKPGFGDAFGRPQAVSMWRQVQIAGASVDTRGLPVEVTSVSAGLCGSSGGSSASVSGACIASVGSPVGSAGRSKTRGSKLPSRAQVTVAARTTKHASITYFGS